MDKLTKHLKGIAQEADKMLQSIPLPENATPEQIELLNKAKGAFDFSGDMKAKQESLNTLLNAFTNNR